MAAQVLLSTLIGQADELQTNSLRIYKNRGTQTEFYWELKVVAALEPTNLERCSRSGTSVGALRCKRERSAMQLVTAK
jgi:hypothetical protein